MLVPTLTTIRRAVRKFSLAALNVITPVFIINSFHVLRKLILAEMSHCLQIQSLKENLEKIIIKNFLNEDNIVKLCEESILFEMKE